MKRFSFNEPSAADKLLTDADELKIHVLRLRGGRLVADFEIHGHIGELFDEDDNGEPLPEVDTMGFVRDVLGQFERSSEKGGTSS